MCLQEMRVQQQRAAGDGPEEGTLEVQWVATQSWAGAGVDGEVLARLREERKRELAMAELALALPGLVVRARWQAGVGPVSMASEGPT